MGYRQAIAFITNISDKELEVEVSFIIKRLHAFLNFQLKLFDQTIELFEEILDIAKSNNMEDETMLTLYDLGFACLGAERTNHAYEYWNELYQLDKSYKKIDGLVTSLRKEMDIEYKKAKDDFDVSVVDYIDEWVSDSFSQDFLWNICGLKSDKEINIRNIMVTTKVAVEKEEIRSKSISVDYSELNDLFCKLDTETFRIISNRVSAKLGYKVDEILQTYREADGVDFLASSLDKKEKTLISVRRWGKTKVGEIPLRNFAQYINDIKAKHGVFITSSELTLPAENSLSNLSKVEVIFPEQLGNLLNGLI